MRAFDERLVPDLLLGLAPATAGACGRCGRATRALANGRSRVDICGACGTMDVQSRDGLDVWSLRGTPVAGPAKAPAPAGPARPRDPYRLL